MQGEGGRCEPRGRGSEVHLPAEEEEVRFSHLVYVGMDDVDHQAGGRIRIPVDPQAPIVLLTAGDRTIVEIEAGVAEGQFPGTATTVFAESFLRLQTIEATAGGFVFAVLAGEEVPQLKVVAVEGGVASHRRVDIGGNVLGGGPKGILDGGEFKVVDGGAVGGKTAGVHQAAREMGLGTGAEADSVFTLFLGGRKTDVEHAGTFVLVEGTKGDAACDVDVVFAGADAEIVGIVKSAEAPIEFVALLAVDANAGVVARSEGLHRQRAFEEGGVLGTGEFFEAEVFLVMAETQGTPIVLHADVEIFGIGVAAGEVVLDLEFNALVDGAREEQARATELKTVFQTAQHIVGIDEGVVRLDAAPEFELESIVRRVQLEAVGPLELPPIVRRRGRCRKQLDGDEAEGERCKGGQLFRSDVHQNLPCGSRGPALSVGSVGEGGSCCGLAQRV